MKPLALKFARYRNGNSWGMEYARQYLYRYSEGNPYKEAKTMLRYATLYPIRYRIAATIRFRQKTGRYVSKNRRRYT